MYDEIHKTSFWFKDINICRISCILHLVTPGRFASSSILQIYRCKPGHLYPHFISINNQRWEIVVQKITAFLNLTPPSFFFTLTLPLFTLPHHLLDYSLMCHYITYCCLQSFENQDHLNPRNLYSFK